jgi:LysM repeat protein
LKHAYDQAELLRQQTNDWRQPEKKMDVLALPSRSEVHKRKRTKQKKKKRKWKIKYPLIRLLFVFFILLPVTILIVHHLYDDDLPVVTVQTSSSYEPIDIEREQSESEKIPKRPTQQKTIVKSDTENSEAAEKKQEKPQVTTHVVKENETLFSIAMDYYKTEKGMEIIKKWNHLQTSQLHKGQVLQIPNISLK